MSSKPKKTLSDEQLKKMQEGRKKASEKRKIEREEAKAKAKEMDIAKKSKDKQKLLDLELQALAQQQSRIDNLKIQVERKKEVKSKLKAIKEEDEKEPEQIYEEPPQEVEEQAKAQQPQPQEVEVEKAVKAVKAVESLSNKQPTDEEYAEVFNREARKIREKLPQESKKYFDNATNKFDFTLSLDDNIKGMIDYVKTIVEKNTEIAKSIRDSKRELEDKKEIVQPTHAERVAEHAVNSKIQKLMRMRY
ncbi:MAG: hypothetical protein ACXAAH_13165 [Promethearchaeota archaeon]|jgi:hypothetical protein